MVKNKFSFPDHNQNFWQLASIQAASQGIVAILVGENLVRQHGSLVALTSICIGNLLLWLIGLGVISMSAKNRQNLIQVVQEYLGKSGGLSVVVILMSAFIFWYTIELQITAKTLSPVLPSNLKPEFVGLGLGILISLISIGGIRLIKWISVVSVPFIFSFIIYKLVIHGDFSLHGSWGISFSGVILVASLTLPGTVNFPTFFRHSHSRADSILALTLTIVCYIAFQSVSVFFVVNSPYDFLMGDFDLLGSVYGKAIPVLFVLTTLICLNLVNIYFASAGLEILCPKFPVAKGYLLIGLLGSFVFLIIKRMEWVLTAENIVNSFIINVGVVLLLSYFVKIFSGRKILQSGRTINYICWVIGCVSVVVAQNFYPGNSNRVFLSGVWATFLSFVFIFFVKEIAYNIRFIKFEAESRE